MLQQPKRKNLGKRREEENEEEENEEAKVISRAAPPCSPAAKNSLNF